MDMIIERFKEPSTWRGIVMMATAFGLALDPDQVATVIALGTAIAGAIGIFTRDKE